MKTKTWLFTDEEEMIIREALTEYYLMLKDKSKGKTMSDGAKKNIGLTKALKEDFQGRTI